ncbi:MAG: hypothetical protein BMS9Abin37_0952 [Acidobacteriota bacterium]|nr:MAG: hypothetical protein BMS9Abin37_0952 [Acidobacteriota bacterium]
MSQPGEEPAQRRPSKLGHKPVTSRAMTSDTTKSGRTDGCDEHPWKRHRAPFQPSAVEISNAGTTFAQNSDDDGSQKSPERTQSVKVRRELDNKNAPR